MDDDGREKEKLKNSKGRELERIVKLSISSRMIEGSFIFLVVHLI